MKFDLITNLTYVLIDNFCPCLDNDVVSVVLLSMSTFAIVITEMLLRLQRLLNIWDKCQHLYGTLFAPIFCSGAIWDRIVLYLVQI